MNPRLNQPTRLLFNATLILGICIFGSIAKGQTPSETADEIAARKASAEADLKRYEAELKAAEVDAKRFEILKNQITALTPNPSVVTPVIENEISASVSLNCLSTKIWTTLEGKGINTIIIYDPTIARLQYDYPIAIRRIETLTSGYQRIFDRLKTQDPAFGVWIDQFKTHGVDPGTLAGLGVSALSLFKQDITLTGATVSLDRPSFVASFVRQRPTTSTTGVYDPVRMHLYDLTDSDLAKNLAQLEEKVSVAATLEPIKRLEVQYRLRSDLIAKRIVSNDPNERDKLTQQIAVVEKVIETIRDHYKITLDDAIIANLCRNAQKTRCFVGPLC